MGHRVSVYTTPGASTSELKIAEPAGAIRLFRVAGPAGIRVKVTAAIPGLASVSAAIPSRRDDPSEACSRRGRAVACVQGEEACPMPAATWVLRVRKRSGPAGRIRIAFVVGASARGQG